MQLLTQTLSEAMLEPGNEEITGSNIFILIILYIQNNNGKQLCGSIVHVAQTK